MENCKESVTISLEKYEEMKAEIKELQLLVLEKTVVEYQIHPYLSMAIGLLGIILFFVLVPYFS